MKARHIAVLVTIMLILLSEYGLSQASEASLDVSKVKMTDTPQWLINMIARVEDGPLEAPPASFYRCVYKNQKVFFKPARCCDIPSEVWDEKGSHICSPDGGETGRGDGKCRGFSDAKCTLIWNDTRNSPNK
jgi:hypothetical protein